MTRRSLFFFSLIAFAAPVISQTAQQQPQGFGTIRGTIVRDGTTEPIADIPVSITGRGGITAQEAQTILNLFARGGAIAASIPAETLQTYQDAVRSGNQALSAVSDRDGVFTITNVPAGQQTLRAQLEGYFAPAANGTYLPLVAQQVAVTANQTTTIKISMVPGGTITGRVTDPAGKPLSESTVQILRQGYSNGVLGLQFTNIKTTDDRGEFRLYRLAPGDYYLSASPRPAFLGARGNATTGPQEVQVPTFYPGVTDASAATKISLRAGDDLGGINIQLRTVIGAKIAGRVTSSVPTRVPTAARGTAGVILVPTNTSGALSLDGANAVALNHDGGTFEFVNVAPGSYDVIARLPATRGGGWGTLGPPDTANGPWVFGRTSVDTRKGNTENVSVVVRAGVDVKGRVLLDGRPARVNARITLQPDNANLDIGGDQPTTLVFNTIRQYAPPIADDGSFTFPQIPEGKYRFQVTMNPGPATGRGAVQAAAPAPTTPAPALPAGTYVADIRQGATSVFDNGLVIGGASETNPVEVMLSTSAGSVEGDVVGADQKPVANITVVLVPPDNRRQNPVLYRTSRSSEQGRYTMNNIPPGRYTVYAWESVPAGAYQNAQFMERYAGRGTAVVVQAGARTTTNVSVIRE